MKKRTKLIIIALISIIFIGILGWNNIHYQATDKALSATEYSISRSNTLYFEGDKDKPLVIFYPGALVDAESYSVWAKELSDKGYSLAIVKMPFNMAFLGANRAEEIIDDLNPNGYVIGGHSLGGVMASRFASNRLSENDDKLKGVFFFASYPDEKGNLANSKLPILSIDGSEDQIVNQINKKEALRYLPENTTIKEIEGGNHAGFGTYGQQKGELPGTLSNQEQQTILVEIMEEWLINIK
ncbi:alpha/beta hydrolase [Enterococcus innesii]|uniref:alpha/beta hydrolase n=1 Tax=Enterococcus innesii TaxID=2839759 RepID=UPI002DBD788F|nr:alpha/beta hydrolase [Enterococcus innesii]MEB5953217.1 alpha/beta hydrolase [Enterococcus innesii]